MVNWDANDDAADDDYGDDDYVGNETKMATLQAESVDDAAAAADFVAAVT